MRKIIAIFFYDVKRILKRPIAIVILLGILVIPGIYAWLNINSNWNPYDNTGNLPIAIVNKDKGTTILGDELNMGNSLVESLRNNTAMKWTFTSDAIAEEKVRQSEYYGKVVFPEDFSEKLIAIFDTGEIKRPELNFTVNQKKNPVAPIIINKAVSTIQNTLNQNIVNKLIFKALDTANSMDLLNKVKETTDKMSDKLENAKDSIQDLRSIFGILNQSADNTNDSIAEYRGLLPTVNTLTETTKNGISDIQGAMGSMKDMTDDVDNTINSLEKQSDDIINSINLDPQKENDEIISGKVDEVDSGLSKKKSNIQEAQEFLYQVSQYFPSPALDDLQGKLQNVINEIDNLQTFMGNNRKTKNDIISINKQLVALQYKEQGIYRTYRGNVKKDLDSVYVSSSKSMDTMSSLLTGVNDVAQKSDSALASMMKALDNAKELTDNLDYVSSRLQKKIDKLIDKLHEAKENELYDKMVNIMKNDPESVADFLSTPVRTNEINLYGKDAKGAVLSYGTKVAPFYTILACWVGGTVLISVMKTEITGMEGIEKFRNYQKFLGRFAFFGVLAMIQGLIIGVGDIVMTVQVLAPFVFVVTIMVTSLVFMLFIYSMVLSFGKIGHAFVIIVMVLQIAGSGGTFPIELLPRTFEVLQPVMPFYPAMNALRETIGGFYGNYYAKYMLMLLGHMIIPLLLGLIFRNPVIHLKQKLDRELEKTHIIIIV